MIIFSTLVISLIIVAVTYVSRLLRKKLYGGYDWKSYSRFPGPKEVPILGNFMEIMVPIEKYLPTLCELSDRFLGTYRILQFFRPYIILVGPEEMEVIMRSTTEINKSRDYSIVKTWIGDGLLLSSGSLWHSRRKLLTRAFHFSILQKFVNDLNTKSDKLVTMLGSRRDQEEGKCLDFTSLAYYFTLDALCLSVMGVDLNVQDEAENVAYVAAVKRGTALAFNRMRNPPIWFDFVYSWHSESKEYAKCLQVSHEFVDSVIEQRRNDLILDGHIIENENDDHETGLGRRKQFALMDLLIRESLTDETITDKCIRDEIETFMFEGHDTTGSALTFTTYLIAKHPEVAQTLQKELDGVFSFSSNTHVSYERLSELRYLDFCIKESLRLFPPVPMIGRTTINPVKIKDVYTIPGNTDVTLFIHKLHRNAQLYSQPDSFITERWSDSELKKDPTLRSTHPFAYLPFSAGSRNCIGQKYAMMELKIALAKMFYKFDITLDGEKHPPNKSINDDIVIIPEIVSKPKDGIHIVVKYRE